MIRHQLLPRGLNAPKVIGAFRAVDRRQFVSAGLSPRAVYADARCSLGKGRWLEAPAVAAQILTYLNISPGCRVLEVGTGSGYTAALLVAMGAVVTTIEKEAELARQAAVRLRDWMACRVESPVLESQACESTGGAKALEIEAPEETPSQGSVCWHTGDGRQGWPESGPYDRIWLSGGVMSIDAVWPTQLHLQGFMLAPLGPPINQRLMRLHRAPAAGPQMKSLGPCRFEMLD